LPSTSSLRREQIKLQVAHANATMHAKGCAAPETKASLDQANLYIERGHSLGEPPEDELVLFSILFGVWLANVAAFNGDICCDLAKKFLALAEKQRAPVPLMVGHGVMGFSLLYTGDIAESRTYFDEVIALYDPNEHRSLAMRFGGYDRRVQTLCNRANASWLLGYSEAALSDAERALGEAHEIAQAPTLMTALANVSLMYINCREYEAANVQADELVALADERGASGWKPLAMLLQGSLFAFTGEFSDAVRIINSGMTAFRSIGNTIWTPFFLSHLARAHANLGQFDDARQWIGEAMTMMEVAKEKWCEAELHRIAGEIGLKSPDPDAAKAERHFNDALAVARAQQAKSWELRAAMSMARLWRDQGKGHEARALLAPVYGWFTEGFDTRDLREAKALLDELAA
jgi:predicted ATPase